MSRLLNSHRIINSKKQTYNLKKILTSAKISEKRTPGSKKCNKPRCTLCSKIIEGTSYEFNNSEQFIIQRELTCDSKNVIYVLKCNGCNLNYIGVTNDLRKRIANHKSNVKVENNRMLNVSIHIHECANKFQFMPIYQNHNYDKLLTYELKFIQKYKTALDRT